MKYKLRFDSFREYEVEADSEKEALALPVPQDNHRASISIISKTETTKDKIPHMDFCRKYLKHG